MQTLRIKGYVWFGAICILATLGIYFIRETNLLRVRDFEVRGVSEDDREEILQDLTTAVFQHPLARFLGAENFLAWSGDFALPPIRYASIEIERKLFAKKILAHVELREPFAIWCMAFPEGDGEERCHWIDRKEGVVLAETFRSEGQLIPTVFAENPSAITIGSPVLAKDEYRRFMDILENTFTLGIPVSYFRFRSVLAEFETITASGARLTFSLQFDPAQSFGALIEILKATPLDRIASVNFTVPGKVYLTKR